MCKAKKIYFLKCNFSNKKATEETKRPEQRNSIAENARMKS